MEAKVKKSWKLAQSFINNKNKMQQMMFVITAVVVLIFSTWNVVEMRRELEAVAGDYVGDTSGQMAAAIRDTIELKRADLINVADCIARIDSDSNQDEIAEFMHRKAQILEFDTIIFLKRGGDYILSSEAGADIDIDELSQMAAVRWAFTGWVATSYSGGQSLFYAAPVWSQDRASVTGVLAGTRNKSNMQSMIESKSFDGRCLSCIVDGEGQVVLSPADLKPFTQLKDIFKDGSEQVKTEIQEMQDGIAEGKDGIFKFVDVNGKKEYLAYNSLEVNDWVLLTIIPADVISGKTNQYIVRSFLVIAGIFLIFVCFWILLYRIYSENHRQLEQIAFEDPVTGGMNDKAFQMKYRWEKEKNQASGYAVALMDIRNFTSINEIYGRAAGNELLTYIYRVIQKHLQEEKKEFVSRAEADHFFLCLREQEPQVIRDRLGKITADINSFQNADCPHTRLSFRQGVCLAENRDTDITALQDRARMALQSGAYRKGQECLFYDESLGNKVKWEREIDGLFEESLKNHDFEIYLQPKVGVMDGRLKGAEALVRWIHPEKGMIFPSDFIPLFENNGKIRPLDYYIFEEICRVITRWQQEGKPLYHISVNLSRYHFYYPDFLDRFEEIYRRYDIPDGIMEFEFTESIFFESDQNKLIQESISRIHRMGLKCSLDDFGSGYSSLGMLKEFDVDTVKLDRSFFLNMSGERAREVLRGIAELAGRLHMKMVAEGIEYPEQLEFLKEIQCDEVQGYIYSKPLPVPEFDEWAQQREMQYR